MNNAHKRGYKSGFTLIELLVVIAIIGLLSSVVFASLNSARGKARDAKRMQDLRQISTALQLYYDANGSYPPSHSDYNIGDSSANFMSELVSAGYLPSAPRDPQSPSRLYYYYNYGGGNNIGGILVSTLETLTPTTATPPGSCRPFTNNWCSSTIAGNYWCLCHPY